MLNGVAKKKTAGKTSKAGTSKKNTAGKTGEETVPTDIGNEFNKLLLVEAHGH